MGMFDEISFECEDCGRKIIAQSKSGDCCLNGYEYTNVPVDVAIDANRHAPYECECGSVWEFGNVPNEATRIALTLNKVGDNRDDDND